jgi:peptidylprolyl isomerase
VKFFALIAMSLIATLAVTSCGGSSPGQVTTEPAAATSSSAAKESTTASTAPHGPRLVMSKREIAKLPKLTIAKRNGPPPRHIEVIDLRKGSGAAVTTKDAVFVRYFDVSYPEALERSRTGLYGPRIFALNEVVKGWDVGLPGMRVGGRRELILPPRLVFPRWKPSWGYTRYTDIYVIDLLRLKPGGAGSF